MGEEKGEVNVLTILAHEAPLCIPPTSSALAGGISD